MSNKFKELVTECAKLIGFEKPDVKEDFYALLIDRIRVLIEPADATETEKESLFFYAQLETLNDDEVPPVSTFILQKNAEFSATGGTSIGVLPNDNIVTIYQLLPSELDRAELVIAELNKFVDIAEQVKKDIAEVKYLPTSTNQPLDNTLLSV
ncbi:type III secretion system chaperone [Pseudoalteromonas sp. MMG024]|uniref:type III secretion system chaperone n=1 Tax=Pseudoalteromonas sp. MMG024 TaxID=2909980 RepID=UPI001F3162CA|nr:type III secretion system chaperone [Pseudoalteromonas sp. MMG024]MCF6455652.1 type III secretion system chaperone [Pseudoalteromonas sp. MMG024]